MDCVHVVNEGFHGLMHPTDRLIHGMLQTAQFVVEAVEGAFDIIFQRCVVEGFQVDIHYLLGLFQLFYIRLAHVWGKIEIECRYSLTSVHLVLSCFQRYARYHTGCLNAFCRTALAMTCHKTMLENFIERMLHAGQRLGRVVVFVVDMDIVVQHGLTHLLAQQIIIHKGLCAF